MKSQATGCVPGPSASVNIGWQKHIQQLQATNYFATRNDGGGTYDVLGDFDSNANDTGSLLLGLGFDGVASSDPKVQAALKSSFSHVDRDGRLRVDVRGLEWRRLLRHCHVHGDHEPAAAPPFRAA